MKGKFNLTKKLKFIIGIVVIFIIAIILTPKIYFNYVGFKLEKELFKSSSIIDINDLEFRGLSLMDSDLYENEIFFAGENHGSVKSREMNMYLLKYFVEKGNIKYILYEGGYCTGELLNNYLETGDENILSFIQDAFSGTSVYTMEHYNLLKHIYNYNLTLSEDKKLKFVGVDIEHQPNVAIRYIRSLIPDKEINDEEVREFIDILKSIPKQNYNNILVDAIEIMNKNQEAIRVYFGEKFFNISLAIRNLSISNSQQVREKYIISNFIEQYEYLPKGKWFGQFGGFHTQQEGAYDVDGYKPFASYLDNEYENTKGKVISIQYDYLNGKVYNPGGGDPYPASNIISPNFYQDDEKTRLVKLNYEGSMFNKKDMWLNDVPQTDYFQYIIMFNNSEAANKYYR